jgi:hypothetical protein
MSTDGARERLSTLSARRNIVDAYLRLNMPGYREQQQTSDHTHERSRDCEARQPSCHHAAPLPDRRTVRTARSAADSKSTPSEAESLNSRRRFVLSTVTTWQRHASKT